MKLNAKSICSHFCDYRYLPSINLDVLNKRLSEILIHMHATLDDSDPFLVIVAKLLFLSSCTMVITACTMFILSYAQSCCLWNLLLAFSMHLLLLPSQLYSIHLSYGLLFLLWGMVVFYRLNTNTHRKKREGRT